MKPRLKALGRGAIIAGLAFLMLACASTKVVQDAGPLPVAVSAADALPPEIRDQGEYRIASKDIVEIKVLGQSELDRTVRVADNGTITLPLIGAVVAANATASELETRVAQALGARFIRDPQVSVFVKEFVSQKVTIEGAVTKPGVYPMPERLSLLQLVATAQGLGELADPRVVVFRWTPEGKAAAVFDVRAIRRGELADPTLAAGDMVVVETSTSKTALKRFIEIVPAIGLFSLFR